MHRDRSCGIGRCRKNAAAAFRCVFSKEALMKGIIPGKAVIGRLEGFVCICGFEIGSRNELTILN